LREAWFNAEAQRALRESTTPAGPLLNRRGVDAQTNGHRLKPVPHTAAKSFISTHMHHRSP
jgi:hypothetical protein